MKQSFIPLVSTLLFGFLAAWLAQDASTTSPQHSVAPGVPQRRVKQLRAAAREALGDSGFLPNFDVRSVAAPANDPAGQQRHAVALLRQEVADVEVEFEPLKGSPRHVMSPSQFLTQTEILPRRLSHPEAEAKIKDYVNQHRLLFGHGADLLDTARLSRRDITSKTGLQTLIWQQRAGDHAVYDSFFRANVSQSGEIMGIGSELMRGAEQAAVDYLQAHPTTKVAAEQAISLAAANLGEMVDALQISSAPSPNSKLVDYRFYRVPGMGSTWVRQVWLPLSATQALLAWEVTATSFAKGLYSVVIDAQSGEAMLRVSRGAADAVPQYRVYTGDSPTPMSPGFASYLDSFGRSQPVERMRQLVQTSALDATASPDGWISDGFSITRGNNITAYTDTDGDDVPDPGSSPTGSGPDSRTFDFPLDLTQPPATHANASVTNAFYHTNWLHDRLYGLGFTETAGNFQFSNFNRNGPTAQDSGDMDRVNVQVHDSLVSNPTPGATTRNNAEFFATPDGIFPWIQFYLFDGPSPNRDAALDTEVICHEYAHGLSQRLVGGGDLSVLGAQAGGLGEGWSDYYALALLSQAHDNPHGNYAFGAYVNYLRSNEAGIAYTSNYYFGLRRYPKSSRLDINPLTFKDIDPGQASQHLTVSINPIASGGADAPHRVGEVWSSMLWEVRTRLVLRYGWEAGNEAALQLVTDALKLTTSSPNFVQARNAVLMADLNDGGTFRDIIWSGFAKRGLGVAATAPPNSTTVGVVEAFDTPAGTDTTAPVVAFSPLVNQQAIFEFVTAGPTALGGTVNENAGVFFHIAEDNGMVGSPRYWNGFAWIEDQYAPGVLMQATVSGGTWVPQAGLNLPAASDLRNGKYQVTVRATDNAGNSSESILSLTRTVNAETTPPVAAITSPAPNSTIAGLHALTGTASDAQPGSGLTGAVTLTIRNSGDYWSGTAWSATPAQVNVMIKADGTWSCNLLPAGPNFRTGVFTVRAQSFDWAGNVSADQAGVNNLTFTVDTSLDTTAPVVVISSPGPTGSYKAAVNEIYGTATDGGGSGLFPYVGLAIENGGSYWNGTEWFSSHAMSWVPVSETGAWAFSQMPSGAHAREGPFTVTALVYDFGGNSSATQNGTSLVTYTIDSSPPTGSVTTPVDQQHYASFPGMSGTASDANGIESVRVFIRRARDSWFWTGSGWTSQPHALPAQYTPATHSFEGIFTPPTAGVNAPGGTYYYDAIVTDTGGNHRQIGATVIIDHHATFTWTGASQAGSHLWSDPGNWQCSVPLPQAPGPEDIAIISSGTPTSLPNESLRVRELHLNGGTLTATSLTVGTALKMSGGQFQGMLTLDGGSASEWLAGRIAGQLNIQTGATLAMPDTAGSSTKVLGAPGQPTTVNNAGTVTFNSSYSVQGSGGSGSGVTFNNLATGSFEAARDSAVLDYEYGALNLLFVNRGRFAKTGGAGVSGLANYWAFTNETGGVIHSGVYGGVIERSSNAATLFRSGSVLRGPGVVRFASGLVEAAAGTWTVDGNGIFDLAGATLRCPQIGSFALTPGSSGSYVLQWRSGRISGNFDILEGTLLSLPLGGDSSKYFGESGVPTIIDNAGMISVASAYSVSGQGGPDAGVTFNNLTTGTLSIERDGDAFDYLYSAVGLSFNNHGLVRKAAGDGTTQLFNYWTLTNEAGGVIQNQMNSGVLERNSIQATLFKNGTVLRGPGVLSLASGTITAESGGWTLENAAFVKLTGATLALPQTGAFAFLPTDISAIHWLSGTIYGNLSIPAGTLLECPATSGQGTKYLGAADQPCHVFNSGTFRFSSDHGINGTGGTGAGVLFNNLPGGVFDLTRDRDPVDYRYSTVGLEFVNQGRITKSSGTGTAGLFNHWVLTNETSGVIQNEVAGSSLSRGSSQGTLLKPGSVLRGPGAFDFVSGTVTAYAGTWTLENQAALRIQGATLAGPNVGNITLAAAAASTLSWLSGTLMGNVLIPAGTTLLVPEAGSSTRRLASADAAAHLQIDGTLVWQGGQPIIGYGGTSAGATITVGSGGRMDIESDGTVLDYAGSPQNLTLNVNGELRKTAATGASTCGLYWFLRVEGELLATTGTLDISGNAAWESGARLSSSGSGQCRLVSGTVQVNGATQLSGSTFAFMGGTLEGNANGQGVLNSGVLEWTTGTVAGTLGFGPAIQVHLNTTNPKYLAASATLNNRGNLYWLNGPIYGMGNAVLNNLPGGSFHVNQTSYALDHGSAGNQFVNAGTLNLGSPAGVLTASYAWSLTQTAAGILNVDIVGTAVESHDRILAPSSSVSLDGTLNIGFGGGFVPAVGDSFTLISHATRTGAFARVNSGSTLLSKSYGAAAFSVAGAAAPTNHQEWKDLHFGAGSPHADDDLDPDHDGASNLMEFATGGNPTRSSPASALPTTPPNAGVFLFRYSRNVIAMPEVSYEVEWNDGLGSGGWSSAGVTEAVLSTSDGIQQVQASVPAGVGNKRFARLKVSR